MEFADRQKFELLWLIISAFVPGFRVSHFTVFETRREVRHSHYTSKLTKLERIIIPCLPHSLLFVYITEFTYTIYVLSFLFSILGQAWKSCMWKLTVRFEVRKYEK